MPQLLITGANRGIGLALTQVYLAAGWDVLACCRDPEKADELLDLVNEFQGLEVFALDVTDYEAVAELAAELEGRGLDLLLNNAGYYGPKGLLLGQLPVDEWRIVFEVNSIAPCKLAEAFLPHLIQAKGIIANISSKVGSMADNQSGGGYLYRSSKAALNSITKSLALDLADVGVKAVALHPGWVQTSMGGPNALIDVDTSAAGMKQLLDNLSQAQSGGFYDYCGNSIPW
ncbi:SDR family oxidoreductase [Shewanella algae]|uniref:SDR family oxidoreductase n=1 Tax=Shewanella algae TaxID=38313 RepID=UPI000D13225C|nr:SDR family oxidoreductase [Shewanella algae]PSS71459.1 short-chain dehydrogenase [Shewanella algae]TVL06681.1 short-chain dehydrogenase [Shewanella algae]TVL49254.1 short-chain dehydrogenase [Shewanella algae]